MSREDADRALADLGTAHDRIAAELYAMDTHPGLAFLRATPTTGRTLAEWREARARIEALWAQFAGLRGRLEDIRSVRARRSRPNAADLAEVARLLRAPVSDPDSAVTLPRPVALTARMTRECAEVTALLERVASAGSALAGRMGPAVDGLAEVERLAADLGTRNPVPSAQAELARITERGLTDPLGSADELDRDVSRLAVRIAAARDRLAEVARVRDQLPDRLDGLERAIAELAVGETRTARSYATALMKIARPGLPPVPAAAAGLAARLRAVRAAVPAGSAAVPVGGWQRLAEELAELDRAVTEGQRWAAQLADAADGLLERRAELRGRLEAYRVKAARLGFAEHPDLHPRHARARDLLYTSPCDLPAATRAVVGYQHALVALIGSGPELELDTPERGVGR
jgi:hypothetical protein